MSESALLREILLEAPKYDCRLMRNNVGVLEDERGNRIRYGLAVGSADLIGWKTVTTTSFNRRAVFLAIECKSKGKHPTARQIAFVDAVKAAGGIAGIAYSVQDFRRIIGAT